MRHVGRLHRRLHTTQAMFGGHSIACGNRRFSSLIAARGRFARRNVCDSATEIPCWWRKICPKSVHKRWLLRWQSSCIVLAIVYEGQTKDKRQQRSNVNVMYLQQDSQYWWNIFLSRSSQMNTTFYQNRPEETENWANLHLEPHKPITSLWNFCRRVADVPPCETFPAARSEEKWLFSQASHSSNHCSEFRLPN